jgi:electron transport complex protein RnfC
MPCIRCGECATRLPGRSAAVRTLLALARAQFRPRAGIPPVRLHRVRLLRLRVPVAHSAGRLLPLRQERNLGARAREGAADSAREQYEFRQLREAREAQEKAARLAARTAAGRAAATNALAVASDATSDATPAAAPVAKSATTPATEPAQTPSPQAALIAAALERARAQQVQPENTTNLTPEQQAEIAAIEARRAQIRAQAHPHLPPDD